MKMSKKQPTSIRKLISKVFTILCLAVFLYSAYALGEIALDYYNNRKIMAEAQQIYHQIETESDTEKQTVRKQFLELQKLNEDIVGWVQIENTLINYPVLQTTNNEYYLNRNYQKEFSRAGSIFADYRNNFAEENKNIILYGHRMRDDTMFNQLTKFLEEDFFINNSTIYFDTQYASYDAIIFSAYYTTTDFYYIQTDFNTEDEFLSLVEEMKEKSLYKRDVEINEGDTILTLSTCDYTLDKDEGRLVVHAKLFERN